MEKVLCRLKGLFNFFKSNWLHFLAVFLILLTIFVVYWRDLEVMANEALNTEALTHVLLIPLFVGVLIYWKRDFFKASVALDALQKQSKTKFMDELVGLSLCLIAFLIYWYGSYTFYPLEYHLLSLPIFVAGALLVLFNFKTIKVLIIPVIFLIFLVPIPNEITYTLGGNLANINTQASYAILKSFGLPVTLSTEYGPPTITLASSSMQPVSFTIDIPCSGIYTLTAFLMFAVFLAVIMQTSIPKKILIFLLGFILFEILNIVRITAIISAAHFFGEEIAMLIFHTVAGLLLTFAGMILTLFVSEKFLKIKIAYKKDEVPTCPKCDAAKTKLQNFCPNCGKLFNPLKRFPSQKFWAKLVLLLLFCSTIALSINAPVFAISKETIEVTSTWENATNILPQIPENNLKFLYRDTDYERIAKQDASLVYAYFPTNISEPVIYALIGVADTISNLHSWEVCLISMQTAQGRYPLVSVLDSRDIQLLDEPPLIARYLVFKNPQDYTQITLYWYTKAAFKTGITIQQKYVRINLIILTTDSNYPEYENRLLNFGKTVASYWEPIKSQSLVSLSIPAQQTLLAFLTAFIIITKTTQPAAEWRKRTNNLKIFNNLASPTEKFVLQTVTELSGERKAATTRDMNLAIKRKTGKFLKLERLVEILNRLEEYGFIKKDIASKDNRPILVWKG